jgi:hypothetical protein
MENPSICIPRIFNTISRERIKNVFDAYNLGSIDNIDIHVGRDFQRVYIYFKQWYTTPFANLIKQRLLGGEELKIMYDDPWFWKCRQNTPRVRSGKPVKSYRSKYNSRNQIIALKNTLEKERETFTERLLEKDNEIARLQGIITSCMGDEALLRRKYYQQKKAAEL